MTQKHESHSKLPDRVQRNLNSGEEVLHYDNNISRINWFDKFALVFTFAITLILLGGVFNSYILLLLIPLFLVSNVTVPIVNIIMRRPKPYILISSEGIRTNKEFTPWESVHEIGYRLRSNKQILAFYLTYDHDDYAIQKLNLGKSYSLPNTIFLGGSYNTDMLLSKITPYWKPMAPKSKLKEIGVQLSKKYTLTEITTKEDRIKFYGDYKNLKISFDYKDSLPFETIKLSIQLPNPIPFYMEINEETTLSTIKRKLGQLDIQVGWMKVDQDYQFKCSHPEILEQLFTPELARLLERLKPLGIVVWNFGRPSKQEKLKTLSSSIHDTEDVLDVGLINTEKENLPKYKLEDHTHDNLEFIGLLHPNDKDNLVKTKEFVELGVDLSILMSEQLMLQEKQFN